MPYVFAACRPGFASRERRTRPSPYWSEAPVRPNSCRGMPKMPPADPTRGGAAAL